MNNKCDRIDTRSIIYKNTTRSLITYRTEVKSETFKMKMQVVLAERKILRRIEGEVGQDRMHNEYMRDLWSNRYNGMDR